MKIQLPLLIGILVFAGCANVSTPLKTQGDPNAKLTASASLAFLPEQDLRIEKRLFYERAAKYLTDAGYRLVDPKNADYLVTVSVLTEVETKVTISPNTVTPHIAGADTTVQKIQGDTTFRFVLYRRADLENRRFESIWEASLTTSDKNFRKNEEQYVVGIFSHLGTTFDGKLTFKRRG